MIIVSMFGGLGNQLFQYACGRAVAQKLGAELLLDIAPLVDERTNLENFTQRDFELKRFNISANIAPLSTVKQYVPNLFTTPRWVHYLYRAKRVFNGKNLFIERVWQRHHYIPAIENVRDNTYLYGYFQTEKFFESVQNDLRNEFVPLSIDLENAKMIELLKRQNSVSMHIRRGDYANSRFTLLEKESYYLPAIEEMKRRVEGAKFYIFSNDMEWAKANFESVDMDKTFVELNHGSQSYMDMVLMSSCKHNIIANSSFSWWGAWLNPNTHKTVIAPANWYRESGQVRELIPQEWILL